MHDDVIKWKHFPCYWPFVRGIHRWPVNSPHKGQWRGTLMFYLICVWTKGWENNRDADLRRHRALYDVTVMYTHGSCFFVVKCRSILPIPFKVTSLALTVWATNSSVRNTQCNPNRLPIAPLPLKQPWRIWVIRSLLETKDITIMNKKTTKQCIHSNARVCLAQQWYW